MVAIGVSASIRRFGKTLIITMDQPDKHSVLQLSEPIKSGESKDGMLVLDCGTLTFIPKDMSFEGQLKMVDGGLKEQK